MKPVVLFSFVFVALVAVKGELPLAEPCDAEACELPDCRCSTLEIPGELAARDTPQFITLTFDDAVTVTNIETYRDLIYRRFNNNGCPIGVTFYVNHEYTDYQLVNELYNQGFEIALHSISHQTPATYWQEATYEIMVKEFADQKIQMSHFANIPIDSLKGVRIPFLQMAGNSSFHVMADYDLQYDCSWATIGSINPGLWPYTLHYRSTQDCPIPPCPTASIPGPWVMPMVTWRDSADNACSMVDSCINVPADEDGWFELILKNFERHYKGNRAPFGFFVHQWFLVVNPHVERALNRFLDLVNNLNDVFVVNSHEVIDWVKNPVPVNEYVRRPCRHFIPSFCPRATCPLVGDHNETPYWLSICNTCPLRYPWLGNPLGL